MTLCATMLSHASFRVTAVIAGLSGVLSYFIVGESG
jgi:hypothetical protein